MFNFIKLAIIFYTCFQRKRLRLTTQDVANMPQTDRDKFYLEAKADLRDFVVKHSNNGLYHGQDVNDVIQRATLPYFNRSWSNENKLKHTSRGN